MEKNVWQSIWDIDSPIKKKTDKLIIYQKIVIRITNAILNKEITEQVKI